MNYRRTEVQKALTKLENKPCKCMDDITAKLKLVSISDITYEEVKGHKGRGKPKKDEKPVTIAVKVHAVASINSEAVKAAVVNTSPVSELNRGVFAGEFYRSVNSGGTLIDSFASAVEKTRNDSRYRSPAAWGGFRLYIYNLGYLKE